MKFFCGVFIMLWIHHPVISHLTTISKITQPSIQDIGNTLSITCTILYPMEFNVSWVKNVDKNDDNTNCVVLSDGNIILIDDPRLSTRQDIIITQYYESNCYTLQILDFQERDAGVYRCQVLDKSKVVLSADTEVEVQIPPTIINATKSLTIQEGRSLKLKCYASGVPTPSIVWSREDGAPLTSGDLTYNGNVLEFSAIKRWEHALYYCNVSNGVGIDVHRAIKVTVEIPPTIALRKPIRKISPSRFLELDCQIDGYPLPLVTWLHEDRQIINSTHTEIITVVSSRTVLNSILRVHMNKLHYGHYTCKASNTAGTQEATIDIHND